MSLDPQKRRPTLIASQILLTNYLVTISKDKDTRKTSTSVPYNLDIIFGCFEDPHGFLVISSPPKPKWPGPSHLQQGFGLLDAVTKSVFLLRIQCLWDCEERRAL